MKFIKITDSRYINPKSVDELRLAEYDDKTDLVLVRYLSNKKYYVDHDEFTIARFESKELAQAYLDKLVAKLEE